MDPLDQFMSVTGVDRDVASSLLEACNWNVELAIDMHLDNSRNDGERDVVAVASVGASSTGRKRRRGRDAEEPSRNVFVPSTIPFAEGEEKVRAPIPPKQEVLVPDREIEERPTRRRIARSVFDGFRDFRAETRAQASGAVSGKRKTLEDLFRPPLDVMFGGSFDEAKSAGQSQGKWLLVNIQHTREFACQALNRDVWSNPTVKHLLRENFVFWQVYEDSAEGEKYKQFYPFVALPHVAIVDPRTGERLVQMEKVTSDEFISIVSDFITGHEKLQASQLNHKTEPSPKKKRLSNSIIDASEESQIMAAIAESLADPKPKKRKSTAKIISVESDSDSSTFHSVDENDSSTCDSDGVYEVKRLDRSAEEPVKPRTNGEQVKKGAWYSGKGKSSASQRTTRSAIESAVINSIVDHSVLKREDLVQSGSEVSSGETTDSQLANNYEQLSLKAEKRQDVMDKQQEERQHETVDSLLALPEDECGERSNLLLRLPDGSRKAVSLSAVQPLAALLRLVESLGFHLSEYSLVTHFPRRNLGQLDSTVTLKDSGLFPSETIFIQQTS